MYSPAPDPDLEMGGGGGGGGPSGLSLVQKYGDPGPSPGCATVVIVAE